MSYRPFLDSGALRQMQGLPEQALDCCAPAVAADLSIDLVWTGWPDHVQVKGQALIARTDAGGTRARCAAVIWSVSEPGFNNPLMVDM